MMGFPSGLELLSTKLLSKRHVKIHVTFFTGRVSIFYSLWVLSFEQFFGTVSVMSDEEYYHRESWKLERMKSDEMRDG